MKPIRMLLAAALGAAVYAAPATAETLLIEAIAEEPANVAGGLPRPTNGMRMDQVEQRFGAPKERSAPVGTPGSIHQPPITQWSYDDFTVYFENDRVITSVLHR
jgi:hypothetical protein